MKKRKLYYIPGLISIIGLPILLIFFGPQETVRPTGIKINLPTDRNEKGMIAFSRTYINESLRKKKIITIDLGEDRSEPIRDYLFYKKRDFITREIERLQFTHDTSTVLHIQLGDVNTYGEFIWVLNQAKLNDVKKYFYIDDDFYFLANPPVVRMPAQDWVQVEIDMSQFARLTKKVKEPTKWEVFQKQAAEKLREAFFVIRHNYVIVAGFLVLIILPGAIRIRKNLTGIRLIYTNAR